jgi:hypothetical protein
MFRRKHFSLLAALCLLWLCLAAVRAQDKPDDGSKSIKAEEFLEKRRPASSPASVSGSFGPRPGKPSKPKSGPRTPSRPAVPASKPKPVYQSRRSLPKAPPPGAAFQRLGLTIWRKDKNAPAESGGKGVDAPLSRADDGALFRVGDKVRFGVEPLTQGGYLYIIDREQFSDGTQGPATLVFPAKNTYHGKNWALPGAPLLVPGPNSYFTINVWSAGKSLAADVFTVILSPVPLLAEEQLGDSKLPLSDETVRLWEQMCSEENYSATLQGGAALRQSEAERSSGAKGVDNPAATLTQADLPPQQVYQATVKPGQAMLVRFSLRYQP